MYNKIRSTAPKTQNKKTENRKTFLLKFNIQHSAFKILFLAFFFCSANSFAQNWDINLLESINPKNPSSGLWKATSSSTYPTAISLPVGLWIDGKAEKNKITEKHAYEMAGSIVIAGIASQGMKIVFNRSRPYEKYNTVYPYKIETDNSFPSGHTSIAFAVATSVSIEYKKWYIVVPAYVWAAGVGYSRLYLGEHYPTDVLAGAVTGAGSAIISHWLTKKIFK
jgi:membrane-associated phospholipid phosphatase